MRGPGRKRGTWRCKHGRSPHPQFLRTLPLPGSCRPPAPRSPPPGRPARPRGPGLGGGVGAVQGPGGPRPGGGPRGSGVAVVRGGGGMCAAGRVALLASPSRGAGPAPGHPLGRSDVEKCPWRPGSLSGPGCGLGVGGGGGPGPSPPPLPRRGGPPGAPRLVPAGGGDRAGRGRGKRQLRFQRVCPSASSRCRRTGRCEAWKPVLEGRNRSDSMHSDSVGPGTLGWTWKLDWIRPLRVPSH